MSPSLSAGSQKVLRVLLQQSALSGDELSILTELEPKDLFEAMQELLSARVISANQPLFNTGQVLKTYFNLNPSARGFAEFATRYGPSAGT